MQGRVPQPDPSGTQYTFTMVLLATYQQVLSDDPPKVPQKNLSEPKPIPRPQLTSKTWNSTPQNKAYL